MPEQLTLDVFDKPRSEPPSDLFFALVPDETTRAQIAALTESLRGAHGLKGRLAGPERLHATLLYLGTHLEVPERKLPSVLAAVQDVAMPPFVVVFDHAMSFEAKAKKPFVLTGEEGVLGHRALQKSLHTAMLRAGIKPKGSGASEPHITLLYDDIVVPKANVEPIRWTVGEFVLLRSLVGQGKHVEVARWPLR